MSEVKLGGDRSTRLLSVDAYRGFVMLLMATGGLGFSTVSQDFADSQVWHVLDTQFEHVTWKGCSLWDLIQPSFMFIVGVAMPFSYANRRAEGQSWLRLFAHAVGRSLILVALGVFLASAWSSRTNFTFTNVLAQIGLGYVVVFLLLGKPAWVQLSAALVVLVGYWVFFALHPLPAASATNLQLGLPAGWNRLEGFAAHWDKNSNAGAQVDRWLLNQFPRPASKPFNYDEGGYTTLNFIPSIATMIFGVMAGGFLRGDRNGTAKIQTLLVVGALCIAAGTMLDKDYCPVVKRIWTPSWVITSTGWTCWMLAFFYGTIDVAGFRRWAFPLVVVGVNSIAMYLMAQLMKPFITKQLKIHCGPKIFDVFFQSTSLEPIAHSVATVVVLWLICLWMYRQRIFVKI